MIDRVVGVDFSGAALAGGNIWLATVERRKNQWRLTELSSLEKLCGSAERETALPHLVSVIRESTDAIWAMDFPFALPIEIMPKAATFADQLRIVTQWRDGANALGLKFCKDALALGREMHIRRRTDLETKTPFDCYHYRIIHQTFHGMREVLAPLAKDRTTAILPFHYDRMKRAGRIVVEACPSSTLKRLSLPHQNYKQPMGGPLAAKRKRTRRAILDAIANLIHISPAHRRVMMRNPGGDALDAVIAAAGIITRWQTIDHRSIRRHDRYPLEGYIYG